MGPHPHHHHSSPFHSIMTRRTALSVALGSVGSILLVACGTRGHEGSSASSTGSSPASSPSVSPLPPLHLPQAPLPRPRVPRRRIRRA